MLIVYKSNTGHTAQYAKMLAQKLNTFAYSVDSFPDCHKGEESIFFGWLMAGGVMGYKQAKKLTKVRAVVGVGMSPESPELAEGFREALKLKRSVAVFYLQGGFDLEKLRGPYKLIMKLKVKEIAGRFEGRTELSPGEQLTLDMTRGPASAVSEEKLDPILDWLRQ